MITQINITTELGKKKALRDRTPHTSSEEEAETFAKLSNFRDGAIFVGTFSGQSCWEKHKNEEIVFVLDGLVEVTILNEGKISLEKGMMAVIPTDKWHRLCSNDLVTVITVTPLPTTMSIEVPEILSETSTIKRG